MSRCFFSVVINSKIPPAQGKIKMNKKEFEGLWKRFETLCEMVFEWPRHNVLWKILKVAKLIRRLGCKMADFDGCMFGLHSIRKGYEHRFLKKPWAFTTNIPDVAYAFRSCCSGVCEFHQHDETCGKNALHSQKYTPLIAHMLHVAFYYYYYYYYYYYHRSSFQKTTST